MTKYENWYRSNQHQSQESRVSLILEHPEEEIHEAEIRDQLEALGREMKLELEPAHNNHSNYHRKAVAEGSRYHIGEECDDQ